MVGTTDSYTQLPVDGAGKKIRTRTRVVGADTVHEQGMYLTKQDTWIAYADAVTPAASKHHITIFNASGSGKIVKILKLYEYNLQTAAVTGVWLRFNVSQCTTSSAGTAVTPRAFDTTNTSIPAQLTVTTGGTVTVSNVLFPHITSSEEESAVVPLSKTVFNQVQNLMPDGENVQPYTIREGQGLTVQQITSSTVGSFGWALIFSVE